ncbi:MAG: prepilin-type N-terminal cleavage/methylation domain-containing protein [Planctomycetes bacterium]|nr:prepilin-type N-terminal cleavage/methylation domain-containing protein [Planctomycetota bacterium]
MSYACRRRHSSGLGLLELALSVALLGVLVAIALPRFVDFSGDAGRARTLAALGSVRTAISLYFSRTSMPAPAGGNRPWWPSLSRLQGSDAGPGPVLDTRMPDNPFSTRTEPAGRNDVLAGSASVATGEHPAPQGTTGAWAYDEVGNAVNGLSAGEPYGDPTQGRDIGQFWAGTDTPQVGEYRF